MAEKEEAQNIQENIPNSKGSNKKGKKKGLLALLLLLLVIAAGWWYMNRSRMDDTTKYWFDKFAQDGTLEGKTPQEIQEILDAIVEEGMFNVSINAQATFQDGKSKGKIGMENIPQNRYYCRLILRMDEDQTVLYESQGIKPGQYINEIELKKNLPAGEYPCTAQIIATDPETLDDIGKVEVKVKVVVVN
ncbi:MAG: hypothetical protein ACRDBO_16905 [Lachnospiraceae bacterium]